MSEIQETIKILRRQIRELEQRDKPKPVVIEHDEWVMEIMQSIPSIRDMIQEVLDEVYTDITVDFKTSSRVTPSSFDNTHLMIRMVMQDEEKRKNRKKYDFYKAVWYTNSLKRTQNQIAKMKADLVKHIEWVKSIR